MHAAATTIRELDLFNEPSVDVPALAAALRGCRSLQVLRGVWLEACFTTAFAAVQDKMHPLEAAIAVRSGGASASASAVAAAAGVSSSTSSAQLQHQIAELRLQAETAALVQLFSLAKVLWGMQQLRQFNALPLLVFRGDGTGAAPAGAAGASADGGADGSNPPTPASPTGGAGGAGGEVVRLNLAGLGRCEGAILGYFLRQNQTVLSLDLSDNQLGDLGAAAVSSCLRGHNHTLRHLFM